MGINTAFKSYCKQSSLDLFNFKIKELYEHNKAANVEKKHVKFIFLAGKYSFFFVSKFLDENDQMIIMNKDLNRKKSKAIYPLK